jgi:hypothetical protein
MRTKRLIQRGTLTFVALVAVGTAARALPQITIGVDSQPSAPLQAFGCTEVGQWIGGWKLAVAVFNRTDQRLKSVTLRFKAYDKNTTRFWDQQNPVPADLDSGEAADYPVQIGNLSFDADRTVKITCSVTSGTFTNGKVWNSPDHWPGKLLALHKPKLIDAAASPDASASTAGSKPGAAAASTAAISNAVTVAPQNSWTTRTAKADFIHVRVQLTAKQDVTVHSPDLVADIGLPSGGFKAYSGIAGPAPQVPKGGLSAINAAMGTPSPKNHVEMENAVSPADDLGSIGSLSIKAGQSATTIVTFDVTDLLAATQPGHTAYTIQGVEFRPSGH